MEGTSTSRFRNICVFCGSQPGKNGDFVDAANNLGRVLAERKLNLVYGGGSLGLMGCVSTAARVGGSKVLGIIPKPLAVENLIGKTVGEELQVLSMHARMANMLFYADAFIALPDGLGTLEEIFQIASWAQLNLHKRPIGLLNVNHFFDDLFSFLDKAVESQFISQATRQIFVSASTANELLDKLHTFVYEPGAVATQIDWTMGASKKRELDLTLRL